MSSIRFFLVGPGRVGLSLGAAWVRAGHSCMGIEGGTVGARRRACRSLGCPRGGGRTGRRAVSFDLLLIATPDREISRVARAWARRVPWKGRMALHTSGALSSEVLVPLRECAATVASLHPLTSLPRADLSGTAFRGVSFGLEGDAKAVRRARRLVREVGGTSFEVPFEAKPLYHLCACIASGYLLALLESAAARLESQGISPSAARRGLYTLAQTTLANARELGAAQALTGPMVRGDLVTLRTHLRALAGQPRPWPTLHRGLAHEALKLALKAGRISPAGARRLKILIDSN